MATRSLIGIKMSDVVKTIYCHWDGYPSGVGQTLVNNYNTPEIVDELIELGDLSSLGETPVSCYAYHRDRNEPYDMVEPREVYYSELNTLASDYDAEYVYVFNNELEWECFDNEGNPINILAAEA